MRSWILKKFSAPPKRMFDYGYLHPYDPKAGLRISIDACVKPAKGNALLRVFTCFIPPGNLYRSPGKAGDVWFTRKGRWGDSPALHTFTDGFQRYQGVPGREEVVMVADVRSVVMKKGVATLKPYAWGLIPLFDTSGGEAYVRRGAQLVPLYQGGFPTSLLHEMMSKNAFQVLEAQLSKGKRSAVKLMKGASLAVRVLDPRLESFEKVPSGVSELPKYGTKYLPTARKEEYLVDMDDLKSDKRSLAKLVPKKTDPDTYSEEVTKAIRATLSVS
jgi:hypothetical protein